MKYKKIIFVILLVSVLLTACKKEEFMQLEKASTKTYARIISDEFGAIDIRLYDGIVPQIINNLKLNIDNYAYENMEVTTVVEDFCIVLDAENDRLTEAEDLETEAAGLYPFYGALCIPKDSGSVSSLMLVTADKDFIKELEELVNYKGITLSDYFFNAYGIRLTDKELDKYRENGGAPWISEHYTVIGQVYNGFDALENLSMVLTDTNYVPAMETYISTIELSMTE